MVPTFRKLRLLNTESRKLEEFHPFKEKKVKMYTCGPSIYLPPHIGNYRTFLYEDILQRYLEYLGYSVERALNITDVEDKAIAEAKKEGTTVRELTQRNAKRFFKELQRLGAKLPDYTPRSSTAVEKTVEIIKGLLKKGYAYRHDDNIYFDPLKFKGFGRLYGLDLKKWPEQKRRFHRDTYQGNRWNRGDFILWHGYKEGDDVCWKTDLGRGRPAWNVQDPAMAMQSLGKTVDIYCGGVDNLFRHHDYVIAVTEGFTGEQFAKYWLHGEHLFVNGGKMSKSRGNIIYPKDLIGKVCDWQTLRFFLIYGYYRKRLYFTNQKFKNACDRLKEFKAMVNKLKNLRAGKSTPETKKLIAGLKKDFEAQMNSDLHVKNAFDGLFRAVSKLVNLAEKGNVSAEDAKAAVAELRRIDRVLQVIF